MFTGRPLEGAGRTRKRWRLIKSRWVEPEPCFRTGDLGESPIAVGENPGGVIHCDKAQALAPNYAGPFWIRAAGFYQLKRYEEAAQEYQRYLAMIPITLRLT